MTTVAPRQSHWWRHARTPQSSIAATVRTSKEAGVEDDWQQTTYHPSSRFARGDHRAGARRGGLLIGQHGGDPSPAQSTPLTIDGPALATLVEQMAEEMQAPGLRFRCAVRRATSTSSTGPPNWTAARPITFADHVRVGSNTKTFTGTAILQMVQEGKLNLDEPVSQYIDGVPDGENIPIRLLLNMRSGLFNYSETLELNESPGRDPEAEWTPQDLLDLAFSNPPYFARVRATTTRTPTPCCSA